MPPSPQLLHEPHSVDVKRRVLHQHILGSRTLHWADEAACAASAQRLAQHLELRDAHIELTGPLGAGKTTFVRHLLHALGVGGRIKSPTYTVVEPYELPGLAISHFDFYRFNDAQEWQDAGFRDIFASPGLKLCEWPEKAGEALPVPDLHITITPLNEDAREVLLLACSPRGLALIA